MHYHLCSHSQALAWNQHTHIPAAVTQEGKEMERQRGHMLTYMHHCWRRKQLDHDLCEQTFFFQPLDVNQRSCIFAERHIHTSHTVNPHPEVNHASIGRNSSNLLQFHDWNTHLKCSACLSPRKLHLRGAAVCTTHVYFNPESGHSNQICMASSKLDAIVFTYGFRSAGNNLILPIFSEKSFFARSRILNHNSIKCLK